jgi:hypothetical protein
VVVDDLVLVQAGKTVEDLDGIRLLCRIGHK